jgi:LCP family protein required for cell wall assembly
VSEDLGVVRGAAVTDKEGSARAPVYGRTVTIPFLSFLWPGLGQYRLGRRLIGLAMAVPPALLILGLVLWFGRSPETFVLRMLAPSFALGMIVLIALHAIWRLTAILDAWRVTRRGPLSRDRALPLVAVLSLAVIVSHGFAGLFIQSFSTAGQPFFGGGTPVEPVVGGPTIPPLDELLGRPTPPPEEDDEPEVTLPTAGPLNVLLVGVDSGPGRDQALTDTLIVASFDPHTDQMVMVSIPRDTGRLPMYDGAVYGNRINSLMSHARRNPEQFPDGPIETLRREVSFLVGIPIHYYAVIDMAGFEQVVDMVGGVTIDLDHEIADPQKNLYLKPGRHHLEGKELMRFVRSRHGPNNSDYRRASRQQVVLRALADRLRDPGVAARLPEITQAAANISRSDVPLDDLSAFLDLLDETQDAEPIHIVLKPGKYARRIPPEEVGGRFMTELKMDRVAALSVELFGEYSRYSPVGETDRGVAP